jgi:hypothetical protein
MSRDMSGGKLRKLITTPAHISMLCMLLTGQKIDTDVSVLEVRHEHDLCSRKPIGSRIVTRETMARRTLPCYIIISKAKQAQELMILQL